MAVAGVAVLCLVGAGTALATGSPPAPSSTPPHKRLTQSQWATYKKANAAFAGRTTKTIATFRRCRSVQVTGKRANALAACIGNSAELEIAVTKTLSAVLNNFEGTVLGSCAKALAQYQGALFFWNTSVTAVDRAVRSSVAQVTSVQAQASQAILAAQRVTADARSFQSACAPLRRA